MKLSKIYQRLEEGQFYRTLQRLLPTRSFQQTFLQFPRLLEDRKYIFEAL